LVEDRVFQGIRERLILLLELKIMETKLSDPFPQKCLLADQRKREFFDTIHAARVREVKDRGVHALYFILFKPIIRKNFFGAIKIFEVGLHI